MEGDGGGSAASFSSFGNAGLCGAWECPHVKSSFKNIYDFYYQIYVKLSSGTKTVTLILMKKKSILSVIK